MCQLTISCHLLYVHVQDQSHCTSTDFNTLENQSKPLVLKELRKVWEKIEPDLPFEKGEYDETNTLLLDDSPYKALRNPVSLCRSIRFGVVSYIFMYHSIWCHITN